MKNRPPRWASLLLRQFCSSHLYEEIEGDLFERYNDDLAKFGKRIADRRYVVNVTGFLRLKIGFKYAGWSVSVREKSIKYSKPRIGDMINSYFKISVRNLSRNRSTSIINVLGLSAGLASGLVIFLLVSYLFSFNRDYINAGRTYMVATDIMHENVQHTDVTPRPMGEVLRKDYPFVETAVRLNNLGGSIIGVYDNKGVIAKKFEESRNICFTEPQFFEVFDTEFINGNPKTALSDPNTVVISSAYAHKYFGTEQVLGKTLRFENRLNLTVTGVIENPPSNTQLRYDVLISYATIPGFEGDPDMMSAWGQPSTMCWVVLKNEIGPALLSTALQQIGKKFYGPKEAKQLRFQVIPLTEMFHHPFYGAAPKPILYALIIVGVFLILASCVNFINISTAQAIRRSKEVGVRKAIGSTRGQLVGQFMVETALVCVTAFVIALGLVQLNLPILNKALWMLRANISVLDLFSFRALSWFGMLIVSVILFAGLYPSFVLARFNPVAALKGTLTTQKVGNLSVRKGLVVIQFFITQIFIIGVLVISAQVTYLQNAELGFQKENRLSIMLPTIDRVKREVFRQKLMSLKQVEQVTFCDFPPATQYENFSEFSFDRRDHAEKFVTGIRQADVSYVPVFGLKLLAGNNFTHNVNNEDDTLVVDSEVLVNEKMVKQLGLKSLGEVVGKQLRIGGKRNTIVGVLQDFGLGSMKDNIQPVAIVNNAGKDFRSIVKVRPGETDLAGVVKEIDVIWGELYPEGIFKVQFVDQLVAEFYTTENILLGLIQAFSAIAVLIGCLGLYGLVTFISESKTKEIGVRKVLGANLTQLLWIFGREFGMLMLFGFTLAAPLGWFLMKGWLQGYAHRIDLDWSFFALAAGLVGIITLATISFRSIRAARMNPVKSLRSE